MLCIVVCVRESDAKSILMSQSHTQEFMIQITSVMSKILRDFLLIL